VNTPSGMRPGDPLAVAIEGLCYAGKTTLARELAPLAGGAVISEYTDMADMSGTPPLPPRNLGDVTAALDRFLDAEHRRADAARACGAPVVLLDRSPLTLIAHEHGMKALGVPADPEGAARLYTAAAQAGDILTPGAYLYLAVPDTVTTTRRAQRGPVAAHLMDPRARAAIDRTCRIWLAGLPPGRFLDLDGTTGPAELAATAASWIRSLTPGIPLPPWHPAIPAHSGRITP
jgi:hypothetical protein